MVIFWRTIIRVQKCDIEQLRGSDPFISPVTYLWARCSDLAPLLRHLQRRQIITLMIQYTEQFDIL